MTSLLQQPKLTATDSESEVKIQALEMKPSVQFLRGVSTQVRVEPMNGRWKWWSQCFFKSPGSGKTPSRGMGEVA